MFPRKGLEIVDNYVFSVRWEAVLENNSCFYTKFCLQVNDYPGLVFFFSYYYFMLEYAKKVKVTANHLGKCSEVYLPQCVGTDECILCTHCNRGEDLAKVSSLPSET